MTKQKDSLPSNKSSPELDNILLLDNWQTDYQVVNYEYNMDEKESSLVLQKFNEIFEDREVNNLLNHIRNCILNDLARGGPSGLNSDRIEIVQGVFLAVSLIEKEMERMSEKYKDIFKQKQSEEYKDTPFIPINETNQ